MRPETDAPGRRPRAAGETQARPTPRHLLRRLKNTGVFLIHSSAMRQRGSSGAKPNSPRAHEAQGDDRMLTYNDAFPSKWLKGEDIAEGQTIVAKILKIQIQEIGREKEPTPILFFAARQLKPLPLNRTNGKTLKSLFGKNLAEWEGHRIQLYSTPVEVAGESMRGVRISDKLPSDKQPTVVAPAPDDEDEMPVAGEPVEEDMPV